MTLKPELFWSWRAVLELPFMFKSGPLLKLLVFCKFNMPPVPELAVLVKPYRYPDETLA
jgi:hypothetical protein